MEPIIYMKIRGHAHTRICERENERWRMSESIFHRDCKQPAAHGNGGIAG